MGIVINHVIYLPLRKNRSSSLVFLLVSFGIYTVVQNLTQIAYGSQVVTLRLGNTVEGRHLFDAIITDVQLIIILTTIILFISTSLFLKFTRLGKAMRAVADNPIGASIVGINPERIILISFASGSVLAGIAGILTSLETNIEPSMGLNAIFKAIIASIIGGIGNIPGSLIGGIFLGFIENMGIYKINSGWKDSIAFLVMIVFLIFRPNGIFNVKSSK
jgi:branched-chain amino acid transport system permease protein